jgi:hypothetical protein
MRRFIYMFIKTKDISNSHLAHNNMFIFLFSLSDVRLHTSIRKLQNKTFHCCLLKGIVGSKHIFRVNIHIKI